jgi:hypothetical protein
VIRRVLHAAIATALQTETGRQLVVRAVCADVDVARWVIEKLAARLGARLELQE